jgi:hypothetical protein
MSITAAGGVVTAPFKPRRSLGQAGTDAVRVARLGRRFARLIALRAGLSFSSLFFKF